MDETWTLVVDDDEDSADLMAEVLRGLGHAVRTARDGRSALALAAELRPKIVLLDIGLPGMDGYEVARRIRELVPDVRLVAVTGFSRDDDRARARAAGFDSHLVKPIDLQTLRTSVGLE